MLSEQKSISKIQTVELVRPRAKNGRRKSPSKNFGMVPSGRRRKGRLRNSWTQEVTTGMRERGIGDLEWVDRKEWGRKINLL